LYHALTSGLPVLPIFIFDTEILDKLEDRDDSRVTFIHNTITSLKIQLKKHQSDIYVVHGSPIDAFRLISNEYTIRAVYANHDYEPYALSRDEGIREQLRILGANFYTYKDQVI